MPDRITAVNERQKKSDTEMRSVRRYSVRPMRPVVQYQWANKQELSMGRMYCRHMSALSPS